jgi:uncharacterized protein YndB with AHSA1/START domain
MLRITLIVVAAFVLLVAGVAVVGWMLPKGHRASRTVVVHAPPDAVFTLITDFAHAPDWRSGVKGVTDIRGQGLGMEFREVGDQGAILFRVEAWEPGRRFVTRIADPSLPYGGTWTFDLRPVAGGTELTISEDGEVYNPIFRFMSRFFFSPTATIERYQADVVKRYRE